MKKYLEKHIFSTWQENDDKYYTYLPDDNNKRGKRLLKRTTKDALDDTIIAFYKAEENEPTVEAVFQTGLCVGELFALKPADIVKKQLKNSDKVKKYISVTRTEVK